jgi:Ca-activated chloride channel homolog
MIQFELNYAQRGHIMLRAKQQHDSQKQNSKVRRGAIVVLTAVMLIVFLASVVLSVDVSYMQLTRVKLRAATDAAARAAGEGLSRVQDVEFARQAAKTIAAANIVAGKPLLLDDSDIVFGKSTQQASGVWAFVPNAQPINAVRVFGRRTRTAPSGSVPTFFGRIFNVLDFQPTQAATVVRLDRDICLVLDRSSSMKFYLTDEGGAMSTSDPRFCQPPDMGLSRWGALSVAVQRFVDALDETPQSEYLALASFAGGSNGASSYTACGYTSATSEINCNLASSHSVVSSAMATLSTKKWNGRTNISAGINRGIQVLTGGSARPYAAKTMVLMSDGAANEPGGCGSAGCSQAFDACINKAIEAANNDIIIHTITFGEANPDLMQDIADATGGNHYIAPDAAALQDIFEEIALTLPVMFTD